MRSIKPLPAAKHVSVDEIREMVTSKRASETSGKDEKEMGADQDGEKRRERSNLIDIPNDIHCITRTTYAGPFITATKVIMKKINELVLEKCYGCQTNHPSQKHHECLWLDWEAKIDTYMDSAISQLTESEFIENLDAVYDMDNLWEDERLIVLCEAVEFYHFYLRTPEVVEELSQYIKLHC